MNRISYTINSLDQKDKTVPLKRTTELILMLTLYTYYFIIGIKMIIWQCQPFNFLTFTVNMPVSFDIWRLLAGIAIFLLGMNFLENGLKQLAGRPFKLFLRKQTSNRFKAMTGGVIVTGILQSSSVVNLMVLAFVGAG